mmetsp:Transcript_53331/g.129641  ORF Transcript_53331/g.129641 Transcript_53331/m.129641 type:complete len:99 (-) Transcript_53331:1801-2097(-)
MGNANSQQANPPSQSSIPPVCIDCDISKKRDLPATDDIVSSSSSSSGSSASGPCAASYQEVEQCMKEQHGQIAPCAKQWSEFNQCHQRETEFKKKMNR